MLLGRHKKAKMSQNIGIYSVWATSLKSTARSFVGLPDVAPKCPSCSCGICLILPTFFECFGASGRSNSMIGRTKKRPRSCWEHGHHVTYIATCIHIHHFTIVQNSSFWTVTNTAHRSPTFALKPQWGSNSCVPDVKIFKKQQQNKANANAHVSSPARPQTVENRFSRNSIKTIIKQQK